MSEREHPKHVRRLGSWRFMWRRGGYRWACERRPVGTLVLATPWFIGTALRARRHA